MRSLFVLALLIPLVSGSTKACDYCYNLTGNPIALPHPKAIQIAVATRTAIEKGTVQANPLVRADRVMLEGSGLLALQKVPASSMVVHCVNGKQFSTIPANPATVHILFIDSSEACGLDLRGGLALLQPRLSTQSDGRIVLTKSSYYALQTGRLTLSQAIEAGLVVLEGEKWLERFLVEVFGSRGNER